MKVESLPVCQNNTLKLAWGFYFVNWNKLFMTSSCEIGFLALDIYNGAMEKPKPVRDYKRTLLSMVEGSVGSGIFKSFWVETPEEGSFDSMDNGRLSCAFYVSGMLSILGLCDGVHGTVNSTIADLVESGWQQVDEPTPGDIVHWVPNTDEETILQHIGFYVGENSCISNDWQTGTPQKHALDYDSRRIVKAVYRCTNWNRRDNHRALVEEQD